MSTPRRKVHQHREPPKTHTTTQRRSFPRFWRNPAFIIALFVILAAITFCLGKYFELSTPGAYDSGAYVYSAAHILDGAEIGVEEKPSAQLGTLIVNMIGVKLFGYSDTGPKIVQALMQLAALALLFFAMKKAFGYFPACISLLIASAYLSSPLIAKYGNVKEQYMIAVMIAGISLFILYQFSGKWYQAVLAGAIVAWAPLFKQTGLSAIAAIGLFTIAQPFLKNTTFKKTGLDIALLFAGATAAMAPLFIWIIGFGVQLALPYQFVWDILGGLLPSPAAEDAAAAATGYVSGGRKLVSFAEQYPRVMRYYGLFSLPIALALGSIISRIITTILALKTTTRPKATVPQRTVLLLAIWWILDMAFVWISPRSYEQYYLPLNASAAMLAGYCMALYFDKLAAAEKKMPWRIGGLLVMHATFLMSWHIFFGVESSPYSGAPYPEKRSGYYQRYKEVKALRKRGAKYPWQQVGEYIQNYSSPDDKMYVWGWFPGMYVAAERFSSASKACSMPRPTPQVLAQLVDTLTTEFKQQMPKFIVDSRKRHIPMERPPYELWPMMPKGFLGAKEAQFLPKNKEVIDTYDQTWSKMLADGFYRRKPPNDRSEDEKAADADEAERYRALKPLRELVMNNYRVSRTFGQHVLLELETSPPPQEQ